MKFKKGDKVRCLVNYEGQFTKGKIYTISQHGGGSVEADDKGIPNGMGVEFFELATDLEALIETANAGLRALRRLSGQQGEIETYDTTSNKTVVWTNSPSEIFHVLDSHLAVGYRHDYALRAKPKPKFEVFHIGTEAWPVNVGVDGFLHIGCKKYFLNEMKEVLKSLINDGSGLIRSSLGTYCATKTGIKDQEGNSITWAEAEKLYNAIKDIK